MPYRNVTLEIAIGNVESAVRGPAPVQLLDRVLNPHLPRLAVSPDGRIPRTAAVFDAGRATFLNGALPLAKRTLRQAGIRFRLRDRRSTAVRTGDLSQRGSPLPGYQLRDYQQEVVDAALQAGRGLIDVGTSGGKSLLAADIIARLGLPAIYLVATRTLLSQTVENLRRHLGIEPGIIGDGVCAPADITAALVQSLDPAATDLSRWSGGTLVFDEGHHAVARTWLDLIRRINPRHHYYLSAVPFRSGGDQVVLDALAGAPLTGRRFSAAFLIEKGYACPIDVQIERGLIEGEMYEKPFGTLYREFLVRNVDRNRRIVEVARSAVDSGRSVLILVERIEHGRILYRQLAAQITPQPDGADAEAGRERSSVRLAFVHGKSGRGTLSEVTAGFAAGEIRCLIATTGLFQEGVSIDGIHVLINAGGFKSRAKVVQTVGRGMRRAPGKTVCLYIDFWDDDAAGVFRNHSRQRFRVLKEEGFFVPGFTAFEQWRRGPGGRPIDDLETAGDTHDGGAAGGAHATTEISGPEARGTNAAEGASEQIGPLWTHIAGSQRFLEIDGDGRIHREAVCVRQKLVPESFCKRCGSKTDCMQGGRITWHDESASTASR